MSDIIDTLGLNLAGVALHTVNFAVLLLLLWWIAFRPLMRTLAARERRVGESLERAEQARQEAAGAATEREALLADARLRAAEIVRRAEVEAGAIVARAHAEARDQAADMAAGA